MRLMQRERAAMLMVSTIMLCLALGLWPRPSLAETIRYLPQIVVGLPPVVPETTRALSPATTDRLTSVSPGQTTFSFDGMTPELAALDPGDVMVGDVTAAAPYGFLRRVTHVNTVGQQVQVHTQPATLEDAIIQGSISVERQLTPNDIQAGAIMAPGVALHAQRASLNNAFFFELTNVVLYDRDGNYSTSYDQLRANGTLEFAPTFKLDWDYHGGALHYFEASIGAHENVQIDVFTGVGIEFEANIPIAHLPLGTLTLWVPALPFPIPIVVVIDMPVYLSADGKISVELSTSVGQEATFEAGVRYDDGAYSLFSSLENAFTYQAPELSTEARIKAYIDSPLRFRLYGIAGPWIAARPYLQVRTQLLPDYWWKLYGGIDVPVGVEVNVMGTSLANYEGNALGYRVLLAQSEQITATPTHTPTPTRTPTNTPTPRPNTVDVALIIDSSGSMGSNDPQNMRKEAAKLFIDAMEDTDQVAVVDFDSAARTYWTLQPVGWNRAGAKGAVDRIDSSGGTDIGDGLQAGYTELNRSQTDAPKLAVLLTDGDGGYGNQANLYANRGWSIYTIGMGDAPNESLLRNIAHNTGGRYFKLDSPSQLMQVYFDILNAATEAIPMLERTTHLTQGVTASFEAQVDGGQTTVNFVVTWPGSRVDTTLVDPWGRTINPSTAAGDPTIYHAKEDRFELYRVEQPRAGTWQVRMYGAQLPPDGEVVTLRVSGRAEDQNSDLRTLQYGVNGYVNTQDVAINAWVPDSNYEGRDRASIRANDVIAPLLYFDVSSVPADATIIDAALHIYASQRLVDRPLEARVYAIYRPWVASQATWNQANNWTRWTAPGCNGTPSDRAATPVTVIDMTEIEQWYILGITELVQKWIDHPTSNCGVIFKGYHTTSSGYELVMSENDQEWNRPKLVIRYRR